MVLVSTIEIPQLYMRYVAATALGILAYIFWKEKAEDFAIHSMGIYMMITMMSYQKKTRISL
jgi:hypothetical protein